MRRACLFSVDLLFSVDDSVPTFYRAKKCFLNVTSFPFVVIFNCYANTNVVCKSVASRLAGTSQVFGWVSADSDSSSVLHARVMGLCNSLPSLQCGFLPKRCCLCCCVAHRPVDSCEEQEGISPLRYVFHWSSLASVGSAEADAWPQNLAAHSKDWSSPGRQLTLAELSPLLAKDSVRIRIAQSQPLSCAKVFCPPTCPSNYADNPAGARDVSLIAEKNGSKDVVVRSELNRSSAIQTNPPPSPGLSDFWNELSHTLHFLRFSTPVMCEVSYAANCAPAARLFIPNPTNKSFGSPITTTPPPSPAPSVKSASPFFAVRSSSKFIRVSSLREKPGIRAPWRYFQFVRAETVKIANLIVCVYLSVFSTQVLWSGAAMIVEEPPSAPEFLAPCEPAIAPRLIPTIQPYYSAIPEE